MRGFIVLCLVAAVSADKLGYNYRPVGHSPSGLSFAPGSGVGGVSGGIGGISGGIGGISGGSDGISGGIGGGSIGFGSGGSYGSSGNLGGLTGVGSGFDSGAQSIVAPVTQEANKEFFSFSAPEEEFEDAEGAQQLANSLKKNVRVIFIKGPENNGLEKAALALARNAAEQKTAIYVLQKQHDIADLANKLQSVNNNRNHHPEVHFVKYRNQDDLVNAKQTIQSQYDQEPGASQNYNGGIAPVINFASPSRPIQSSYGSYGPQQQYYNTGASNTNANYLPPSLLRRLRF
ncbi:glycine, alanine and asparagine-rich protein [Zeugodacus cucurbitae]|nr:glycine, alanine and asparagine-rich protein [Zeugodacus cucurbitae]